MTAWAFVRDRSTAVARIDMGIVYRWRRASEAASVAGTRPKGGTEALSHRANIGIFLACLALALLPVLLTQHPPLLDYPNHLARLYILTHPDDPYLSQYYQIDWSLLPNLGFDLIGYALASLMPVDLAGRVFIGIANAVMLSAPMALHRALYGRLSPLPLFAGAIVFNRILQEGFLGYYLGAGLAVWAFALHLLLRGQRPVVRYAFLQAAALVLYLVHLYAVAVLAVLVLSHAAAEGWRAGVNGGLTFRMRAALRATVPVGLPFVLPFLLLLASRTAGSAGVTEYWPYWRKFAQIPWSLTATDTAESLGLAAMALLPPLIARLAGGRMLHLGIIWPAAGLLALYFVLPNLLLSSANADWRVIIPLALVLAGGAEDPFRKHWVTAIFALVALAINAETARHVVALWRDGDRLAAEIDLALAKVPPGSMLLPYMPGQQYVLAYLDPPLLHWPPVRSSRAVRVCLRCSRTTGSSRFCCASR